MNKTTKNKRALFSQLVPILSSPASLSCIVVYEWSQDEIDQLKYLVDHGWNFQWPGWRWVARRLNQEYGNNRSSRVCQRKYAKLQAPKI